MGGCPLFRGVSRLQGVVALSAQGLSWLVQEEGRGAVAPLPCLGVGRVPLTWLGNLSMSGPCLFLLGHTAFFWCIPQQGRSVLFLLCQATPLNGLTGHVSLHTVTVPYTLLRCDVFGLCGHLMTQFLPL